MSFSTVVVYSSFSKLAASNFPLFTTPFSTWFSDSQQTGLLPLPLTHVATFYYSFTSSGPSFDFPSSVVAYPSRGQSIPSTMESTGVPFGSRFSFGHKSAGLLFAFCSRVRLCPIFECPAMGIENILADSDGLVHPIFCLYGRSPRHCSAFKFSFGF